MAIKKLDENIINEINEVIMDAWDWSIMSSEAQDNIYYAIDCWGKLCKLEQYLLEENKQQCEHGVGTIKEIMKIIS